MGKPSVTLEHELDASAGGVPAPAVNHTTRERPAPRLVVHHRLERTSEFSKAILLEENRIKSGSRTLSGVVAAVLHVSVIAGVLLAGLYYTDSINLQQFTSTTLVAPPPPPPPPAPPTSSAVVRPKVVRHSFLNAGKLIVPTVIPKHIAEIKEQPLEPGGMGGVVGGVPGGVPGGQLGGVLGGVIGGVLNPVARPPAPPRAVKPTGPIRVGGHIRPPKVIVKVTPEYPPLARQTHTQGQVQIDAILDTQGNVIEMKVLSGPPLLYQAALDAVGKWKYEPTYLNDKPVAVRMIVTVTFQLGQ